MYILKEGVNDTMLKPQMRIALTIMSELFDKRDLLLVVTSTYEGEHSQHSLHYHHLAIDVRTRHVENGQLEELYNEIKQKLRLVDKRYQAILTPTHIHLEYDRRRKNG